MPELEKLSDLTRCPVHASAGNRFAVTLPGGGVTIVTPEQYQVAATVRVAEALEELVGLAKAGQVTDWLGTLAVTTQEGGQPR